MRDNIILKPSDVAFYVVVSQIQVSFSREILTWCPINISWEMFEWICFLLRQNMRICEKNFDEMIIQQLVYDFIACTISSLASFEDHFNSWICFWVKFTFDVEFFAYRKAIVLAKIGFYKILARMFVCNILFSALQQWKFSWIPHIFFLACDSI